MNIVTEHRATEIADWASRVDASASLPRLVSRLLLATTRLSELNMPVDEQTSFAGADGLVRAAEGNAFCPEGTSLWELSTRKDLGKLREDFQKRSATPPPGIEPSVTTYVAVSARVVTSNSKATFLEEASKVGIWRYVKLLDAQDLATWLESAPAVSLWFRGRQGLPVDGLLDLETCVEEWVGRVTPPLRKEILLLGEERKKVERLLWAWLESDGPRFFLQGADLYEALAYAATVLQKRDKWAARALIVQSPEAMRWLKRAYPHGGLVVLPSYASFDVGQSSDKYKTLVPGAKHLSPSGDLGLLPVQLVIRELQLNGLPSPDAARVAQESNGHIPSLLRLLGYNSLPSWAEGIPSAVLTAMLLMGAWCPDNEADKALAGELAGNADALEQSCVRLSESHERPVRLVQDDWGARRAYKWTSPVDAWRLLGNIVPASQYDAFFKLVLRVFGETDPRFELDVEQRFAAAVYGKTPPTSDELRTAVCESLVRTVLTDGEQRYTGRVRWTVRELLGPDWRRWATMASFLPTLAEAAPEEFLKQLEALIAVPEQTIELFRQESSLGSAPHTGLLWALERLAWTSTFVSQVVPILADLALVDPGGKLSNRPAASLHAILHPLGPQSAATLQQRISWTQEILCEKRTVGWKLALSILGDARGGILFPSNKPHFRDQEWSVPEQSVVTNQDVHTQLTRTGELLIENAGTSSSHWVDLLDAVHLIPEQLRPKLVVELGRAKAGLKLTEVHSRIRQELYLARRRDDHELVIFLNDAYQLTEPEDALQRDAWLFDASAKLPDGPTDWREQERAVERQRVCALEKLWRDGVLPERFHELFAMVERPWSIGWALAMSELVLPFNPLWRQREFPADFSAAFVSALGNSRGTTWVKQTIMELIALGRRAEALACAMRALQPGSESWAYLGETGIFQEYWEKQWWFGSDLCGDDTVYAVEQLVKVRRPRKALEVGSYNVESLTGWQSLNVLVAVKQELMNHDSVEPATNMDSYHLEKLLERVDQSDAHESPELFGVELFFLGLLEHGTRPPKAVYTALEQPEFFVKLLQLLYRSESDTEGADDASSTERQQIAAKNAWHVLHAWRSYPGQSAASSEKREAALADWASGVFSQAKACGRTRVAAVEVAKVLARAPVGDDGAWPCLTARDLIESREYPDFADHVAMARHNLRGVVMKSMGEGGRQEHLMAEQLRQYSGVVAVQYPRTARMLMSLAQDYESEAAKEDARGQANRNRYSDAPRTFATKEEFKEAVEDLYEEYSVASLVLYLHQDPGRIELLAEPPESGVKAAVGFFRQGQARIGAGWLTGSGLIEHFAGYDTVQADVLFLDQNAPHELSDWLRTKAGYEREIAGQLSGIWRAPGTVSVSRDEGSHGILFESSKESQCVLLLYWNEFQWEPLPAQLADGIAPVSMLLDGETMVFESAGSQVREGISVTSMTKVSEADIRARFPSVPPSRLSDGQEYLVGSIGTSRL